VLKLASKVAFFVACLSNNVLSLDFHFHIVRYFSASLANFEVIKMATRQRPGLTKQHAVTNLADQLGKSSDATPVAPASDVAPRQRPGMSKQNGEINIVSGEAGRALLKGAIVADSSPSNSQQKPPSGESGRSILRAFIR